MTSATADASNATPPHERKGWHPFRRMTLRSKLVLAVVVLVAVLGLVISLISALFLQNYLVGRLDDQLGQASNRGERVALEAMSVPGGVTPNALLSAVVNASGTSAGTLAAIVTDTSTYSAYLKPYDPGAPEQTPPTYVNDRIARVPPDATPVDVDLGGTLGNYRMVAVPLTSAGELVIGLPLSEVESTTAQLVTVILLVTLCALVAVAGVGSLIVILSLRPLDRVAATAAAVSRMRLDKGEVALAVRVPEEDTDPNTEVGRVGAALNLMLGHVASALSARQASENKVRQFVADASHELRTPLASIRGYAELTRRAPEALPPDAVRSLGRIESEAERMTGLVEDLLLLARLDEGRELDHDPVDLSRLVIDTVSDAHAAGRDHTWKVDLPPYPVTVVGDEPRLHEVIANLLTNARVHTPEGTTVETVLSIRDGRAVITVTDDGPGIPDDLQPILFERFARGDSSRSRHTGSTGLGLAIVRAVIQAQGGTVDVDSEPGRTQFIVTLPAAASSIAEEPTEEPAAGLAEESVVEVGPTPEPAVEVASTPEPAVEVDSGVPTDADSRATRAGMSD